MNSTYAPTTTAAEQNARALAAELRARDRLARDLAAATDQRRIALLSGEVALCDRRITALGGDPATAGAHPGSDNETAAAIAARILANAKGAKGSR